MNAEILKSVLKIVNYNLRYGVLSEKNIDDDLEKLGLESVKFISVILAVEEIFSLQIPEKYLILSELNTVRKITSIVEYLKKI